MTHPTASNKWSHALSPRAVRSAALLIAVALGACDEPGGAGYTAGADALADTAEESADTTLLEDTEASEDAGPDDTAASADTSEAEDTSALGDTAEAADTTEPEDATETNDTTEAEDVEVADDAVPVDTTEPEDTVSSGVFSTPTGDGGEVVTLDEAVTMDLVAVPAGSFVIGCEANRDDIGNYGCHSSELEPRAVTLTTAFVIGRTEVTQAQFSALAGYDPSTSDGHAGPCPTCPVETVGWNEAAAYANLLSSALGLAPCYACSGEGAAVTCDLPDNPFDCEGYRLPTEAEWEYAARAGADTMFPGSSNPDNVALHASNAAVDGDLQTHPACELLPNALGLCDMAGNVWEWTNDIPPATWNAYPAGVLVNPIGYLPGDVDSDQRAIRGGSAFDGDFLARTAVRRHNLWASFDVARVGFRLVRSVAP